MTIQQKRIRGGCLHCSENHDPSIQCRYGHQRSLQFVNVKEQVFQGERVVARAISKTMAKRIANALNEHRVNEEGV